MVKSKTKRKFSLSRKNKTRTFKKNDFYSGDGFVTSTWGPPAWHLIHTISFNYPVNPTMQDKKHYRDFILSLQNVLPCKYCRINLKKNFQHMPLNSCHMKNRETFSKYIYNLHEHVNKMLGKKSHLSYCDVRERYEHFRARCTQEKPKIFNFKKTNNKTHKKKENGCTEPLYGKKSKCVLKIVPQEKKEESFQVDEKCIKKRGPAPDAP